MLGDAKAIPLADESVQCVVTSPPYWSLRDYGVAGQFGLEKTPEEYVANMVAVFREVRRVLRPDGTLWLNLGDSYCSQGGLHDGRDDNQPGVGAHRVWRDGAGRADGIVDARGQRNRNGNSVIGLKPKDLVGIPWRVAFALQADGWWLRQDIIWAKPNPMPESVTDRCTKSHEYVFLLTKSARYFYDAEAVKEPSQANEESRTRAEYGRYAVSDGNAKRNFRSGKPDYLQAKGNDFGGGRRNRRSVWHIATQPYKEAHFATFPEKLVEPCILAGTSEKGCCAECGAPWERMVSAPTGGATGQGWHDHSADGEKGNAKAKGAEWWKTYRPGETTGWKPTCSCGAATKPCVVLDPFCGSGTVGVVCARTGRDFIGLDISERYLELARQRIGEIPYALPFEGTESAVRKAGA
jgi:DNA modification methylase